MSKTSYRFLGYVFAGVVILILVVIGICKIPQLQVVPLKDEIYELKHFKTQNSFSMPQISNSMLVHLKDIAMLEKGRIDSENAIRTSLIQGIGGLALLATAIISSFNLRETRRNVNAVLRNVEATEKNVKVSEEKQVAERFSKAVELLGNNDNIHARLGGIYALEQIAEYDKYYWQVIETLTAYVRECSPLSLKGSKKITTDIQAVLTVLSRCKRSYLSVENQNQRLDLRETNLCRLRLNEQSQLCGAILSGADLEGADFRGSDLRKVDLREANLQQVYFPKVKLQEAVLFHAKLQNAHLQGAQLQKAKLSNANLQNIDLQGKTNLEKAEFVNANLEGAKLREANLKEASLVLANLKGAWLDEANLEKADIRGADMQGANLYKANLQEAIFWTDGFFIMDGTNSQPARTNLERANLKEADLSNTDLRNVDGLTWKQLKDTKSYAGALLPDYLDQKKSEPLH